MSSRRQLIAAIGAGLSIASFKSVAQKVEFRVAYLAVQTFDSPSAANLEAIKERLRELGYVEGNNIRFDVRSAEGKYERLPTLAMELVALKPHVVIASTTLAIRAAQQATAKIPIVMAPVVDPVGSGFIKSLARPGGNITGVKNLNVDTSAKHIEMLHLLVPKARRIGVLTMPRNPSQAAQLSEALAAIRALDLIAVPVGAANHLEIDEAFSTLSKEKCDALAILADALFGAERHKIANLAIKHRLPAIYQSSGYADAGGLIGYGANQKEMFRMAAGYVDKLLKGAKPENLPVEQPTRLELVINLKAAKAIGLAIPQSFLLRADRVIE